MNSPRPGKIRIIGGKWRGRKLPVPDSIMLRPTPDRVRETLFNWLQSVISGASCLDLFAGTGALGLEAISRGASSVVLVENDPALARQLAENINTLNAAEAELERSDALTWLRRNTRQFDLVFLDPPFGQGLVEKSCGLLQEVKCLKSNALIYIEAEQELQLPPNLDVKKQGSAGQVKYLLVGIND